MSQDKSDDTPPVNPDETAKHKGNNAASASPTFTTRIRNWFLDAFVSAICISPIAYVFEHVADKHTLGDALEIQDYLYTSVKNLNPLNLLSYCMDAFIFLLDKTEKFLWLITPAAVVKVVNLFPTDIVSISKMLYIVPLIGWSILALPIVVIIKGTVFESIFVFVIFLPLAIGVLSNQDHHNDGSAFFGLLLVLGITSLLFWFVQLAMLATLYTFGAILQLAAACCGVPLVGYGAYWAAVHRGEHSVTEHALHVVRAALLKHT